MVRDATLGMELVRCRQGGSDRCRALGSPRRIVRFHCDEDWRAPTIGTRLLVSFRMAGPVLRYSRIRRQHLRTRRNAVMRVLPPNAKETWVQTSSRFFLRERRATRPAPDLCSAVGPWSPQKEQANGLALSPLHLCRSCLLPPIARVDAAISNVPLPRPLQPTLQRRPLGR
jgi:hypothetical protein